MPATYDKHGLHFLYPENWQLSDEGWPEFPGSISLESPDGNAFWSVHVYHLHSDPDEILNNTIETLKETYPDLEVSKCAPDLSLPVDSAVELMFYCLDFLIRTRLQVVTTQNRVMLFWYQAEDRQFDQLELVFKAISTSLLSCDLESKE